MSLLTRFRKGIAKAFRFADDTTPARPATSGAQRELAPSADDPWSKRKWLKGFINSGIDPDSVILPREVSDDGYYQQPYGIFDEMLKKDTQISASRRLRIDSVLDGTMAIQPADDSPEAVKIAEWAEWAIAMIGHHQGSDWRDVTGSIMNSVWYGFEVAEMIWGTARREGSEYWILDQVNPKRQRRFTFNDDNELMMFTELNQVVPVPDNKFLVTRLYPACDSPWGTPLLDDLYYLFKFKKAVTLYWIMYCEKFGMPLPVGKLEPDYTGTDAQTDEFDDMLAGISQDGWARLQQGQSLNFAEFARSDTTDLYERFMVMANREISKVVLGATMVMEETSSGTQAMAAVLQKRFTSKINSDSLAVAREWNRGIIRPLILMNFGEKALDIMPQFVLTVKEETDILVEMQAAVMGHNMGQDYVQSDIYQLQGREEPKEGDKILPGGTGQQAELQEQKPTEGAAGGEEEAEQMSASDWWERFEEKIK